MEEHQLKNSFAEEEWMRMLFVLADTQEWMEEMSKRLFHFVPVASQRKYQRQTYYLTVTALSHILEGHYYKINRHPSKGKFHVSLPRLLELLRDASAAEAKIMNGSTQFYRELDAGEIIGFDRNGHAVQNLTVITDAGGRIVTAFPGSLR